MISSDFKPPSETEFCSRKRFHISHQRLKREELIYKNGNKRDKRRGANRATSLRGTGEDLADEPTVVGGLMQQAHSLNFSKRMACQPKHVGCVLGGAHPPMGGAIGVQPGLGCLGATPWGQGDATPWGSWFGVVGRAMGVDDGNVGPDGKTLCKWVWHHRQGAGAWCWGHQEGPTVWALPRFALAVRLWSSGSGKPS